MPFNCIFGIILDGPMEQNAKLYSLNSLLKFYEIVSVLKTHYKDDMRDILYSIHLHHTVHNCSAANLICMQYCLPFFTLHLL